MAQRIIGFTLLGLVLVSIGCADSSSFRQPPKSGEITTSTDDIPPPPRPAGGGAGEQVAPLAFKEEQTFTKLPSFTIPDKVRERLQKVRPDLVTPKNDSFKVTNQHLKVSVKNKTFTFTGVLKITGKEDEQLEMQCSFDPNEQPWSCADMFPVDRKKAEERRLQATVNCMDVYKCSDLGVELFVVINGKTKSQLFQSEPFRIARAESGDYEEDEHGNYTPPAGAATPGYTPPAGAQIPGHTAPADSQAYTPPAGAQTPAYIPPDTKSGGTVDENGSYKPPTTSYLPPLVNDQPKVLDKATPAQNRPAPMQRPEEVQGYQQPVSDNGAEGEDELGDEELEELLNDPNTAAEVSTPMNMPSPKQGAHSIVGIEVLRPKVGSNVPEQAYNKHSRGFLKQPAQLPKSGAGYKCMSNDNYGTNLMIEMITKVSASAASKYPVVVRDISNRIGGKQSGHASHQTGLDADIGFPSTKPVDHFFAPCAVQKVTVRGRTQTVCRPGTVGEGLDEAAFWKYLKTFTNTEGKVVLAIFVDQQIKKYMCAYARSTGEDLTKGRAFKALRALKHSGGHHHHIHVRLHCPSTTGHCRESTVTLANGSGC